MAMRSLLLFLLCSGLLMGSEGLDHPEGQLAENEAAESDEKTKNFDMFLDSGHKVLFRWSVDYEQKRVDIRVEAVIEDHRWIAVGFSNYGNVTNADYCLLYTNDHRKLRLQDVWSDESGSLHVDRKQDCHLVEAEIDKEKRKVRWRYFRSWDTCDEEDYALDEGTVHVVWVLGGQTERASEDLLVAPHGFQRAQLLKPPPPLAPHPPDTSSVDVLVDQVKVPGEETTYWCRVVRLPEMRKRRHVIQFEAVIQKGHESLVHHVEVFHCEVKAGVQLPLYDGPCGDPQRPKATQACMKVISAWAMGAQPFVYPEEAGLPVGGPEYSPYVMLEVHYNNPELRNDYVDSSGIRLYYTGQLRRFDAAVLEVGLEYSDKMAIPPAQHHFPLSGHCNAECTRVALPVHGITLFAAQLHTHLTGKNVFVKHFRGRVEMDEMARDNHYSSHFQEIRHLRRRLQLLPGDELKTTCVYDTSSRENITLGGYAISDEMCVSYIHYFPKSDLEVCKSSIDSDVLDNYFRFLQEYENKSTSGKRSVAENFRSIEWTPLKSLLLKRLYAEAPLSLQCNQSSGERFPGNWNNVPQSHPMRLQPETQMSCG